MQLAHGKTSHDINSHIAMQVVHEFSDAQDLLQLSSHSLGVGQAQQAQQAAAEQLAGVSNLIVSSTGRWAAVVKGSHVHVFDLEAMRYHGRLPALQVGLSAPFCHLAFALCRNLHVFLTLETGTGVQECTACVKTHGKV